jgi:ParB-like chromosome segregation protein Spo0J
MKIRDRIKELRRVKASELHPNPKNWRTHPKQQLDAIRGILAEVGFAGAELARELPDGSLQLIDGHARAEIAGDAEIPVLVLDVTESEADKILATYDPIGAMAEADAGKLEELLREVQTGSEALAEMLADLAKDNGILGELNEDDTGQTEEINPDSFELECKCPKCGFEFDPKT